MLNEAGYRTRNGSKFSDTTVSRLIQDPIAKGVRRSNYTKSLGEKKHWKLKPQDEWVLIDVPAIVSEELWNECNAILEDRRKTFKKPAKLTVHLFSGLTFCTCGSKMYVPSNMKKYRCGKCRSNIPIEDLETVFHEQLKNYAFSPTQIVQYMEGADQTIKEKEQLLNVLLEEQRKVTQDMDRLYELYLAGEIPKEGFGVHRDFSRAGLREVSAIRVTLRYFHLRRSKRTGWFPNLMTVFHPPLRPHKPL